MNNKKDNNNNLICQNCGFGNKIENLYCNNCGNPLNNKEFVKDNQNNSQVVNQIDKSNDDINNENGDRLALISLLLFFAPFLLDFLSVFLPKELVEILSVLCIFSSQAGIIVMIAGRIKYPNNTLLKISMWIMIVLTIIAIILYVLFMMWCYTVCGGLT